MDHQTKEYRPKSTSDSYNLHENIGNALLHTFPIKSLYIVTKILRWNAPKIISYVRRAVGN